MKFSDGYWLGKDNYIINSPIEAYDTEVTDTEISGQNRKDLNVYASYQRLNTRSDMLDVGNSTISLFSPTHDVIGVRIKHFDQQDGNPLYDLAQTPVKTKITRSSDAIKYKSGSLEIEIPLHTNFRMDFKYKGEKITASELKAQASIDDLSGHELGKVMHPNTVTGAQALFKDSDINWADHFMREQLSLLP